MWQGCDSSEQRKNRATRNISEYFIERLQYTGSTLCHLLICFSQTHSVARTNTSIKKAGWARRKVRYPIPSALPGAWSPKKWMNTEPAANRLPPIASLFIQCNGSIDCCPRRALMYQLMLTAAKMPAQIMASSKVDA